MLGEDLQQTAHLSHTSKYITLTLLVREGILDNTQIFKLSLKLYSSVYWYCISAPSRTGLQIQTHFYRCLSKIIGCVDQMF